MKNPIPGFSINNISVYSLCGSLPNDIYDFNLEQGVNYVEVFPNPSSMQLNFKVSLPDNLNDYELMIFNSNSRECKREKIGVSGTIYSFDVRGYSSGTYFYSLASKNKVVQTGKFILVK